jgi:hypothetical protein
MIRGVPGRTLVAPLAAIAWMVVAALSAGAAADEEAFLAAYRKAFVAKDTATLNGFLYTTGANPMVVDFYKTMQAQDLGNPKAVLTLEPLTPDDVAKAAKSKDGPGGPMVLPLKPSKKLVTSITTDDANGKSTSTSSCFVAEHEGRLVIPVPVPAK